MGSVASGYGLHKNARGGGHGAIFATAAEKGVVRTIGPTRCGQGSVVFTLVRALRTLDNVWAAWRGVKRRGRPLAVAVRCEFFDYALV